MLVKNEINVHVFAGLTVKQHFEDSLKTYTIGLNGILPYGEASSRLGFKFCALGQGVAGNSDIKESLRRYMAVGTTPQNCPYKIKVRKFVIHSSPKVNLSLGLKKGEKADNMKTTVSANAPRSGKPPPFQARN